MLPSSFFLLSQVKHAGNTAEAKKHGKAKLRWMAAARQVMDANKKQRREARAARPLPPGGGVARGGTMRQAAGPPGSIATLRGEPAEGGTTAKPTLQRARSGTLSIEQLDELKRAAREADKTGTGKRPKMVRRKSGSMAKIV